MGDFIEEEYPDHSYLLDAHLLPNQTVDILIKIMEHHREHMYVIYYFVIKAINCHKFGIFYYVIYDIWYGVMPLSI